MTFIDESYWKYSEVKCQRLYDCFSYVFNLGIRWSQGIGYHFIVTNYEHDSKYWYKWLYEVIFYVIINRVLMLVIFGIIVSTFGQLRAIAQKRKNDQRNVCFVCGLNRETFALHGQDFDYHLEVQHDPWMYLSYVYYLEKKGKDELSGIEQTCWENYEKKNVNWCPIGQTGYLGEINKAPPNTVQNDIDANTSTLTGINDRNQQMINKMREIEELFMNFEVSQPAKKEYGNSNPVSDETKPNGVREM